MHPPETKETLGPHRWRKRFLGLELASGSPREFVAKGGPARLDRLLLPWRIFHRDLDHPAQLRRSSWAFLEALCFTNQAYSHQKV
jgi:hypothetical protein